MLSTVGIDRLSALCGRDYSALAALLDSIDTDIAELASNVKTVLGLITCRTILPIYVSMN